MDSIKLKGLSEQQVREKLEQYGENKLEEGGKKSTFRIFLEQFQDFLVVVLIAAAIISGFMGDIESAVVILVVITMNAVLGTWQHKKAEQSLESLKDMAAPNAKVVRAGHIAVIAAKDVVPGDIMLLEAGDYVPADGRILENAGMKMNESALTGESTTVDKAVCDLPEDTPLGDRINMVFSGSFLTYGRGTIEVTQTGMNTELGKIAKLLKNTKDKKTPLQMNLDRFGKTLSILIIGICIILFAVSMVRGIPAGDAFLFAVALAVAAIPEALSSIVTIVLAFGTRKLAKENAIIRQLQAVEGLGSVSVICSDKTGTLTQNKMTVKKPFTATGEKTEGTLFQKLVLHSILCSDASIEGEKEIGDPTETALLRFGETVGIFEKEIKASYERKSEIPFDSDRKLMSAAYEIDGRKIMITKGAVDVLLPLLSSWEQETGIETITEKNREKIQKKNQEYSENGLRVLAFAYKELPENFEIGREDEKDFVFLGLISMIDPPRVESAKAVAECKKAGIKPVMITGDHKITAAAIAKEVGILEHMEEAVEGSELDALSDEEMLDFVVGKSVYARVSPEHKIRIVRAWQEKGHIVSMTGDGVNDAPALKQADIGVAMGITGTEVAKDAASMILTDDNFATIVKAVENGRNVYANIKKSIQFLLSGNTAGIIAVLYASLMGLPVPFAPVHLLFINLLTDSLPAIALGLEPHNSKVMEEKPREKNESILTKDFLGKIGIQGFVIAFMTLIAFYIGLKEGGAGLGSTMAFATLCFSRLVHGFNCKDQGFFNNKYLLGAFAVGTACLAGVLLIPGLQRIFSVTPLSLIQIVWIAGLSFANLVVIQILKRMKK